MLLTVASCLQQINPPRAALRRSKFDCQQKGSEKVRTINARVCLITQVNCVSIAANTGEGSAESYLWSHSLPPTSQIIRLDVSINRVCFRRCCDLFDMWAKKFLSARQVGRIPVLSSGGIRRRCRRGNGSLGTHSISNWSR